MCVCGSAEVVEERVERPFEKIEREREREKERERERERDRDREREEVRERDRRKPRREEIAPYSKNKRGKAYIFIIKHTHFQSDVSYIHGSNILLLLQGEKKMRWTPWIPVLTLMPRGTVYLQQALV